MLTRLVLLQDACPAPLQARKASSGCIDLDAAAQLLPPWPPPFTTWSRNLHAADATANRRPIPAPHRSDLRCNKAGSHRIPCSLDPRMHACEEDGPSGRAVQSPTFVAGSQRMRTECYQNIKENDGSTSLLLVSTGVLDSAHALEP